MKKQKKIALTPAAKKAKRRKVWGTVCLCLAALLIVEGIILGIALHDNTLLYTLIPEGLVLLAAGILLRRLSKRAGSEAADLGESDEPGAAEAPEAEATPAAGKEDTAKYMVRDIFDDALRTEIHDNLDTLSRIYRNFFGAENTAAVRLASHAAMFEDPEKGYDRAAWLNTAAFLRRTAETELALNYKDALVDRGEKAILDFFAGR